MSDQPCAMQMERAGRLWRLKGVVDLPALLQAARALGADAVVDPDLDVGDPRVQLQAAALVYGAAEAGAINAAMESARLGVDNPIDQINTVVAEAAGLGDLDTALAWMTWNASRVGELAAQHVDEHPSPELAAATALATALQAVLSALAGRRRGDQEKSEALLAEALVRMRDAAENLNQPR